MNEEPESVSGHRAKLPVFPPCSAALHPKPVEELAEGIAW